MVEFKCPRHGAEFVVKFPREGNIDRCIISTSKKYKCGSFIEFDPKPVSQVSLLMEV